MSQTPWVYSCGVDQGLSTAMWAVSSMRMYTTTQSYVGRSINSNCRQPGARSALSTAMRLRTTKPRLCKFQMLRARLLEALAGETRCVSSTCAVRSTASHQRDRVRAGLVERELDWQCQWHESTSLYTRVHAVV